MKIDVFLRITIGENKIGAFKLSL